MSISDYYTAHKPDYLDSEVKNPSQGKSVQNAPSKTVPISCPVKKVTTSYFRSPYQSPNLSLKKAEKKNTSENLPFMEVSKKTTSAASIAAKKFAESHFSSPDQIVQELPMSQMAIGGHPSVMTMDADLEFNNEFNKFTNSHSVNPNQTFWAPKDCLHWLSNKPENSVPHSPVDNPSPVTPSPLRKHADKKAPKLEEVEIFTMDDLDDAEEEQSYDKNRFNQPAPTNGVLFSQIQNGFFNYPKEVEKFNVDVKKGQK